MPRDSFETQFADWKKQIEAFDQLLHPVVSVEIDINEPGWEQKLDNMEHPADETGLRQEITTLFDDIVARFEFFDRDQRQQIIDLMAQKNSLMHSAIISADIDTPEGFRKHMILMAIEDQGKDTRDCILALQHYRKHAEDRGINVDTVFHEMSTIASKIDKYGWGTTSELFLTY